MQEEPIDLRRYMGMVLRWWWVLILGPITAGALFYWQFGDPELEYEARSTILVQQTRSSALPTLVDMQISQRLTTTYQRLITTGPVLEEVAGEITDISPLRFSAGNLRSLIRARVVPSTQLLEVIAVHTDPEVAAFIAQTVSEIFIHRTQQARLLDIARLQAAAKDQGLPDPGQLLTAQLSALGSLSIVDPAVVPTSPLPSGITRTVVAGLVLGILVAVLAAFTLEYLTDKVRTVEEVEKTFGLTSLGVVLRWPPNEIPFGRVFQGASATSGYAEMFRQVRANFQFAIATSSGTVFAITSSEPAEGKTTLLTNLGVALALNGKRVVLVDSDLRRPTIHKLYGIDNQQGLSTLLSEPDTPLSGVIKAVATGNSNVSVITSGPIPPNPAELLGSRNMGILLERLKQDYDLVLLDSPPVGVVADSMVIASQADGMLIVAVLGETKARALRESLKRLESAGGVILGILFNKVRLPRMRYGYHYRRYYSYYRAHDGQEEARLPTGNGAQQANEHRSVLGAPWRSVARLVSRKR